MLKEMCRIHARIQKVFSEGVQLREHFFLVNEWDQIPLKSGHHRPPSETPFKWHFAGVPMMAHYRMLAW